MKTLINIFLLNICMACGAFNVSAIPSGKKYPDKEGWLENHVNAANANIAGIARRINCPGEPNRNVCCAILGFFAVRALEAVRYSEL